MPTPPAVLALGPIRFCRLPAEPTKLYITARGDSVTIVTLADEPDAETIAEAICGDWNAAAAMDEADKEVIQHIALALQQGGAVAKAVAKSGDALAISAMMSAQRALRQAVRRRDIVCEVDLGHD